MKTESRIELINLLTEELCESTLRYHAACKDEYNHNYRPSPGYGVEMFDCREAIKRRITILREELLELSKTL